MVGLEKRLVALRSSELNNTLDALQDIRKHIDQVARKKEIFDLLATFQHPENVLWTAEQLLRATQDDNILYVHMNLIRTDSHLPVNPKLFGKPLVPKDFTSATLGLSRMSPAQVKSYLLKRFADTSFDDFYTIRSAIRTRASTFENIYNVCQSHNYVFDGDSLKKGEELPRYSRPPSYDQLRQ